MRVMIFSTVLSDTFKKVTDHKMRVTIFSTVLSDTFKKSY